MIAYPWYQGIDRGRRSLSGLWGVDRKAAQRIRVKALISIPMSEVFAALVLIALLGLSMFRHLWTNSPGSAFGVIPQVFVLFFILLWCRREYARRLQQVLMEELRCLECGYEVRGEKGSCPECGAAFDPIALLRAQLDQPAAFPRTILGRFVVLILSSMIVIAVLAVICAAILRWLPFRYPFL